MRGLVLHTIVFMLVTWGMMNIKKEGYAIQENVTIKIAPGPAPEEMPAPPPKMVDAPLPLPGFSEDQIQMFDSGLDLASLDLSTEVDQPVVMEKKEVSCQCENGKTVTIEG